MSLEDRLRTYIIFLFWCFVFGYRIYNIGQKIKHIVCYGIGGQNQKFKTTTHTQITAIEKNCIDCHMPSQPSKSIAVFLQGEEIPKTSFLRSHFIGTYPDEVKKFINKNK